MKVYNRTKNSLLSAKLIIADSLIGRLKGLLGRKELSEGEAMLLKPCYQIHTWFMKFPIDVLFLDKKGRVVHLEKDLKPFRISGIKFSSKSVIELPVGKIEETNTEIGDSISIEE